MKVPYRDANRVLDVLDLPAITRASARQDLSRDPVDDGLLPVANLGALAIDDALSVVDVTEVTVVDQ